MPVIDRQELLDVDLKFKDPPYHPLIARLTHSVGLFYLYPIGESNDRLDAFCTVPCL